MGSTCSRRNKAGGGGVGQDGTSQGAEENGFFDIETEGAAAGGAKQRTTGNPRRPPERRAGMAPSEIEALLKSFCGLPNGAGRSAQKGTQRRAAIPSAAQRAKDPPVAFSEEEQAAFAAQDAKRGKAARARLLPGGEVAEAAAVFIEHRYEKKDREIMTEESAAATEWLIDALEHAYLDKDIADAAKQLLSVRYFTGNLGARKQWKPLQTAVKKLLAEIGDARLAPLFTAHNLQEKMNAETIQTLYSDHPAVVAARETRASGAAAAAAAGTSTPTSKPSQRLACPQLFQLLEEELDFDDPAAMADRVSLHVVLILNHLLNDRFQRAMEGLAKLAGCHYSGAPTKGYARAFVKLCDDYAQLPSPRAAYILDGMRCLLSGPGVLSLHAAVGETSNAAMFGGGLVQIKNPFALPAAERAQRAHLLLVNMTAMFDPKATFAELLSADPETDTLLATLRGAPDNEPGERWRRHFDRAVGLLKHPALADVPVQLCCEVQVTFDAFSSARSAMHYVYDAGRADDAGALHNNFAGIGKGETETEARNLVSACERGQVSMVKKFLAEGGKDAVDERHGSHGETGLYYAAAYNHPDVVKVFVDAGADVDKAKTDGGGTPLCIAAQQGHAEIVQQLVDASADVNKAKTSNGKSPLYIAAQQGHTEIVQQLVDASADVNKARTDKYGTTPLYTAASEGHAEIVQQLVDASADVNKARTDNGTTPLYMAAQKGHAEIVQQLVDASADVNQATTDDGTTPLYAAASKGHAEIVQQLVDARADVDTAPTDKVGATPLCAAASAGHTAIVKLLIDGNASIDTARSLDGETPLYTSVRKGHAEIVQQLVDARADVNKASSSSGSTPTFIAAQGSHLNILQILTDAGGRTGA